jgi:hypothetical protein
MPSPSRERKLTTHQQAVLIQVLLAFPEQRAAVHYSDSASDAPPYAEDFLTIFKAVGWKVGDAESWQPPAAQATGLAILVSQDHGLPPGAEALRDALRIYGIEVETVCEPTSMIAAGSFALSIGSEV